MYIMNNVCWKDLHFILWVKFFFIISFTIDCPDTAFSNSFHNLQKEHRKLLETSDTNTENCLKICYEGDSNTLPKGHWDLISVNT